MDYLQPPQARGYRDMATRSEQRGYTGQFYQDEGYYIYEQEEEWYDDDNPDGGF